MNTYFILQKNDSVIALDVFDNDLAEIIDALQQQGYKIASDNYRAVSKQQAINAWKPKELTPLEKANLTIRKANIRISELKGYILQIEHKLDELLIENESLKNTKKHSSIPAALEKANATIRKANIRISELKSYIIQSDRKADELLFENKKLKVQNAQSNMPNSLEFLGFTDRPNKPDLKVRYKKLCSIYHPDKGGSSIMMQHLNNAYEELSG